MANPYPVYVEDEAGRMGAGKGQGEAGEAGLAAGGGRFHVSGPRRDVRVAQDGGAARLPRAALRGESPLHEGSRLRPNAPNDEREAAHPDCAT